MKYDKTKRFIVSAIAGIMIASNFVALPARAADVLQDVDIYSLPPGAESIPNVLLILDNSANWSANVGAGNNCTLTHDRDVNGNAVTPYVVVRPDEQNSKMGIEKCALFGFFSALTLVELGKINIGLMLYNEPSQSSGEPGKGGPGNNANTSGYPRIRFVNITTETQRQEFLYKLANLGINDDKGNNSSFAETLFEAYKFFRSQAVHKGNQTADMDPLAFQNPPSKTQYAGPVLGCSQNHIIYIANGSPAESNTNAEILLKTIYPAATKLSIPPSLNIGVSDANNWADEYANFFYEILDLNPQLAGQQNIQVSTISLFTGAASEQDFQNYMAWVAEQGGGIPAKVNASQGATEIIDEIRKAIASIFASINAKNSVFAAATLPVSANSQGTYLNQVFIGMFRPDATAAPRWLGNLKHYKFTLNGLNLRLADANGDPAIVEAEKTGFITQAATSFWTATETATTGTTGPFWTEQAAVDSQYGPADLPDGARVEKGGAAQFLRKEFRDSTNSRNVYTCVGSCSDVALAGVPQRQFKTTNNSVLTPSLFGLGTDAAKTDLLIDWVRGYDNVADGNVQTTNVAQESLNKKLGSNIRPSVHGDVLHSRPVAVNYDPAGVVTSNQVVVYYGGNDGMLRAVNGNSTANQTFTINSTNVSLPPGAEIWSYVAEEHFAALNRLRENQPKVSFPSTASETGVSERQYFFDGPIGLYQNMGAPGGPEIYIFAAMRRGGSSVYAFDVSSPGNPVLKWRISPATTGYGRLAQTWSVPKVARVKGITDPVIIMGGGYDDVFEDAIMPDSTAPAAPSRGNRIYIINLRTGALEKELPTLYSVPSEVAVVDSDGDGFVDRAYAVDAHMQVYRVDIEGSAGERPIAQWEITRIADLRRRVGDTEAERTASPAPLNLGQLSTPLRKTFFAPDVVLTRDFTALMIGSGDREKPLKFGTADRFQFVKDRTTKGEPTGRVSTTVTEGATVATVYSIASPILSTDLAPVSSVTNANTDPQGCYFSLAEDGEKIVNQPVSFGGVTYFSTTTPTTPDNSCYVGVSRAYAVPLFCKPPSKVTLLDGFGLPPSPVVGYVRIGDQLVPFIIGGPDSKSPIEGGRPPITVNPTRKRTYWYMENRDR